MAPVLGLAIFELTFEASPERLHMAWHPRHAADPAHRRLRTVVQAALTHASQATSLKSAAAGRA